MNRPSICLCCFARSGVQPAGEEDSSVAVLEVQDVAAIFRSVDGGEKELQDPAWIIPQVCRHEQIVEQVMRHSPVQPVRFGAFFSSPEALEKLLRHRRAAISQFLDAIAGKEEWDVKGYVHIDPACDWLLSTKPRFAERLRRLPDSPGARYFQEKKLRGEIEKEVKTWGRILAEQIHAELAAAALDVRRLRRQGRREAGRELAFHFTVLLRRDEAAAWRDLVGRLAAREEQRGLAVEISGPWPPYNFCPALEEATP